jgi:hypothetical protein
MKTINDYNQRKKGDTPICFFHWWEDGNIQYQGFVVRLNKDKSGTCKLMSWLDGYEDEDLIAVTSSFFNDCTFYDSTYQMNSAYQKHKEEKLIK